MKIEIQIQDNISEQSIEELLMTSWQLPKKMRHLLRMQKGLAVNGESLAWSSKVKAGDCIQISLRPEDFPEPELLPGNPELADILYEDEHLIVANKPEAMKTHPNSPGEFALQNHLASKIGHPVYVVHRLDTETSGAILFAKHPLILPMLNRLLEEGKIHRNYLTLIEGQLPMPEMTVNKAIGRDRHDRHKRLVTKSGQTAISHFKTLEIFNKKSLVSCLLDTGRTHQIRVHLTSMGHPIIGDPLYSKAKDRLMLHARQISFPHPFTGQVLNISASSKTFDEGYQKEKQDKNQRDS
ncbi:RluA family pseudouridine synthase [Lactococcus termiticola]|uniref:Pseudouridine synthase n=1 Tax=Lactococcus termiticola TaxID=2169526 RepID=A0A2R5HEN3_9LACT|nr:RluA family pseudouridine synthase [Lactococcus termiticola]GBG96492.1 ribosomal large subunit pseudouridine synthase D [Lactococcus termiticola]